MYIKTPYEPHLPDQSRKKCPISRYLNTKTRSDLLETNLKKEKKGQWDKKKVSCVKRLF